MASSTCRDDAPPVPSLMSRVRQGARVGLLLVAPALAAASGAEPFTDPLPLPHEPYSRRVWQSADGLPEDVGQAIAQTPDGHLWIGTSGGLARFDGVRFAAFGAANEPAFRDDSVYTLTTTRDGTLWAGTEGGGLIRYREGRFRAYGPAEGLTNLFVRAVFEDRRNRLWIGTDGGLFRLEGEAFQRVDGRDGVPVMNVHTICEDREDALLVGGSGLLVLRGGRAVHYRSTESLADNSIRTIRETREGTLWIGTISGLRRVDGPIRSNPFARPRIVERTNVSVLCESRSGVLWIGTYGRGLMRFDKGRLVTLSAPSPLPHDNVLAVFEDSEDNVWVGTQGGLLRLRPGAASTITTSDGAPLSINTIYEDPRGPLLVIALNGRLFQVSSEAPPHAAELRDGRRGSAPRAPLVLPRSARRTSPKGGRNLLHSSRSRPLEMSRQTLVPVTLLAGLSGLVMRNVFRDSLDRLWIGTDGQGVARVEGRTIVRYTMKDGLVNDFVRAFCEDRRGGLWIGTDSGLSYWRAGSFRNFTTATGLVYGSIRALLLDRAGRLWVATERGLSCLQSGAFVSDARLDALRGHKIWALHEDAEGTLWIGTQDAGLFRMNAGGLRRFTTEHGLPSNKIHFVGEDRRGNLWMSGPRGAVSVARGDLESLPPNGFQQVPVRLYGTTEGLSTNQMRGGVQPAGVVTSAGDVWLANTNGAVLIVPEAPERRSRLRLVIDQVVADGRQVNLAARSGLTLPPGEGKLEIQYTSIRLAAPERVRFRYRMEGFERDWTAAGPRRVAYYTNLPPGRYRFHVVAYEIDAPQHAAETILEIHLRPHFYRTRWFLALCALIVVVAAWGAWRLHVRRMRRQFAAVLDERNRLAREMHDTLIQGCVGVSTLLEAASRAQDVSPRLSHELLDRARTEVRAAVDEARLAVWDLRRGSPTDERLVPAVSQLARRIGLEAGLDIGVEILGQPVAVGGETGRSLMLLIREALQNAIRHASPRHLSVVLRFDPGRLEVIVTDDGPGFDPSVDRSEASHHYGLRGMRERVEEAGGEFHLTSAPGQGTQVRLTIPLAPLATSSRAR